jgi:hypothetical protein
MLAGHAFDVDRKGLLFHGTSQAQYAADPLLESSEFAR